MQSTATATRRLQKDLQVIQREQKNEHGGINATPEENNLFKWQALIEGPQETIWEGGLFELKLQFTEQYPIKAPDVVFVTEMFHPNVYKDGRICLDILKDKWSSVYDVWGVLTSIRSLLVDPNPLSPANPQAAQLYQENRNQYNKRVSKIVDKSLKE